MYLCLVSWHRVAKGCSGVSLCFGAMEGFSTLNPNRVLWPSRASSEICGVCLCLGVWHAVSSVAC